MMGTRARVWSLPGGAELLVPQLSLRRIAYRAVQVAILAAGILAILLVFSRQAHAATSAPAMPGLYAASRPLIGPDPDVLRPGTVLVLPGQAAPGRYAVVAGDTLAGIAAALAVRGGWPVFNAASRRVIGPDPDVIRPGTVLTVPQPAAPAAPASPVPGPGRPRYPVPPPSAPAGGGHRPAPVRTGAPAAAGMPRWLTTVLEAAGLLIGAAFLAEPVRVLRRRRWRATARLRPAAPGEGAGSGRLAAGKARVVLADYDRWW